LFFIPSFYFSICTFNENHPLIFLLPSYFHWANYTLSKTFSLERKKAQNEKENFSQKLGGTSVQKLGEVAPDFHSRFWEIEATVGANQPASSLSAQQQQQQHAVQSNACSDDTKSSGNCSCFAAIAITHNSVRPLTTGHHMYGTVGPKNTT